MKTTLLLLAGAALVVLAAIGFALSGFYDVSARSPHSAIIGWVLSSASHASVERQAGDVDVPNLDDVALIHAGVNDFAGMCVGCHGAPGQEPEAHGQGLNPSAPNLAESAAHMTPAELFWVTKNGIKMTGMPAWGITHNDVALWPVVAFMVELPDLDTAGYQKLLADAQGIGHHAAERPDDGKDHGNELEPAPESGKQSNHDGHRDHTH